MSGTTESALVVLTEAEWIDLVVVCQYFLDSTDWVTRTAPEDPHVRALQAQRKLCKRVLEATS